MAVDSTRCPPNINSRHNALNSYHHSGHPSLPPRSKSLNLSQRQSNRQPVPRLLYILKSVSNNRSLLLFLFLPSSVMPRDPEQPNFVPRKTPEEKRTFPLAMERSDSIVHRSKQRVLFFLFLPPSPHPLSKKKKKRDWNITRRNKIAS